MGVQLTDAQVREVREKFAAGARQVDLAREYGVSQNTVSSMVTGRSRQDAGGPITRSRRRKLTPEDVLAIRSDLAEGAASADIANRYGISQQMVSQISTGLAHADVGGPTAKPSRRHSSPLTVDQVSEIKRRVTAGEARREVAAAFGISRWTVDSIMIGRLHGKAKEEVRRFSTDDVRCMRVLYKQGATQSELAVRFNTDQQSISQIVRGVYYPSYGGPIAGSQRRRLRPDEVSRIREAFAVGASVEALADRYDVAIPILRQILTGSTYATLPGPTFAVKRKGDILRSIRDGASESSSVDHDGC